MELRDSEQAPRFPSGVWGPCDSETKDRSALMHCKQGSHDKSFGVISYNPCETADHATDEEKAETEKFLPLPRGPVALNCRRRLDVCGVGVVICKAHTRGLFL